MVLSTRHQSCLLIDRFGEGLLSFVADASYPDDSPVIYLDKTLHQSAPKKAATHRERRLFDPAVRKKKQKRLRIMRRHVSAQNAPARANTAVDRFI